YFEDEVSATCELQDVTAVFECGDSGCSCGDDECDGIAQGATIDYCDKGGQTYFQDDCATDSTAVDVNNTCIASGSLQGGDGCTADAGCDGETAGTGNCSAACEHDGDGDGIIDILDKCPSSNQTGDCTEVNGYGCCIAGDGDTIFLQNLTTDNLVTGFLDFEETYDIPIIKWNISIIPSEYNIESAVMCLFYVEGEGECDSDINVSRIANQTWDGDNIGDFENVTHSFLTTFNETDYEKYWCVNVSTLVD
ncbi:unnamed protein product, partial [marine sediment metagenome]